MCYMHIWDDILQDGFVSLPTVCNKLSRYQILGNVEVREHEKGRLN